LTVLTEFNSDSFYKHLAERKLMASKCKNCYTLYLPPHPMCTKCHGKDMEWVQLEGAGKLAAYTVIAVGPTFTIKEGYDRNKPYVVGIVELKEGPKISGRITGLEVANPIDIIVGTTVNVEFPEPREGGKCYLTFNAKNR
jgi:scaffold protein (connect acetoacetyl-CoA thiolase and HMG-CoA synthase)